MPSGPPALGEGLKELQVLGPPRLLIGPAEVVPLGPPELELLARMALEPGRVFTSEELRADIGTAKPTDWAPATLWTRASVLRRAVGRALALQLQGGRLHGRRHRHRRRPF